jgi:hypothetical protein
MPLRSAAPCSLLLQQLLLSSFDLTHSNGQLQLLQRALAAAGGSCCWQLWVNLTRLERKVRKAFS